MSCCHSLFEAQEEAQILLEKMELDVAIDDSPEEALLLLRALRDMEELPGPAWRQQLSAELFHDSKAIGNVPVLDRIYKGWVKSLPTGFGELRLKTDLPIVNRRTGMSLADITETAGQVVLLHTHAARIHEFDLSCVKQVTTCENLSPFVEIQPHNALYIFSKGYANRLVSNWLQALPDDCEWIHFGDFDSHGLDIFDELSRRTGRIGDFLPSLETLEKLDQEMPQIFQPYEKNYDRLENSKNTKVQQLAQFGNRKKCWLEQEVLLAHLGEIDIFEQRAN